LPQSPLLSENALKVLATMSELDSLSVSNLGMDESSVEALKSFQRLHVLRFDPKLSYISPEAMRRLKKGLPGVAILDLTNQPVVFK